MRHYRKLTLNNNEYQFNIGKRFVAIKSTNGTEHVEKSVVGFEYRNGICVVTPKMICDHILGTKGDIEKYLPSCSCENVEKDLRVLPFYNEIYNKINYMVICESCYDKNADEI